MPAAYERRRARLEAILAAGLLNRIRQIAHAGAASWLLDRGGPA